MLQRDCTELCRSTNHGDMITAAITKRQVSDIELCSYLNYICSNCESVKDSNGRTALHLAASCGRLDLVRWLIEIKNANISTKDDESGYTPLHRALFYGKINVAIELIKLGANSSNLDLDHLTAIGHVTEDGVIPTLCHGTAYYWGLNKNNSLGSFSARITPECLDIFHKRFTYTSIKQVCLDKFHSVIVTTKGEVFSCGHGLGGRLGLGTENTIIEPRKLDFRSPEKIHIVSASISRDHSLFLSQDNSVFSCGLNKHRVLGIKPPPDKLLNPQKIKLNSLIIGLSAGKYHSVAWTDSTLYTWGLNAGQLGHELVSENFYVCSPKLVKTVNIEGGTIQKVSSSDGATGILTKEGKIYILHQYKCRKIANHMLDANIVLTGGKLNENLDKDLKLEPSQNLIVVVQTKYGELYIWQESDPYLTRCIFSIPRNLKVKNVTINSNEILFTTVYGEAYKAVMKPRKKKNVKNVSDECVTLQVSKISKIHRAVFITSDPKGEDYCVLQQDPYVENTIPEMKYEFELKTQLKNLLDESNESDYIHDILIKIDGNNKIYPLHKYILAHRCKKFLEKFPNNNDEYIILDKINKEFFEEILEYVYTGTCDLIKPGKCPKKFLKYLPDETTEKNVKNPIKILQETCKKIGCTQLYQHLHSYGMEDDTIFMKSRSEKSDKIVYKTDAFPEYHDIILKCKDDKEINAHKCILAARMEYFNNMFSTRWNSGRIIKIQYSSKIVEALLEFLYTDKSDDLLSSKDCDFLLELIALSDEYLVKDFKTKCSSLILTSNFLELKNAVELLQFSHHYKAEILKNNVMKFIVNNMAFYLETQGLNELNDEILTDLTQCYFEERKLFYRIITPYSTAVSDEIVKEIHETFPVDNETPVIKKTTTPNNKYPKRRIRLRNNSEKNTPDVTSIEFQDTPESPAETNVKNSQNSDQSTLERLKAISMAVETVESEEYIPNFTVLNDCSEFPLLNSPPEKSGQFFEKKLWKSSGKIVKLSQKERKRLSSETSTPPQVIPETPKNPWKIVPELISPVVSPQNPSGFNEILSNERKQKENLIKLTNKLLKHTQLEDKAILELEKFYNIDSIEDEVISVQRVGMGCIASPVWISKNQPHSSYN